MAYNDPNISPRQADIEAHRAEVHQNHFTVDTATFDEFNKLVETPLASTAKLQALEDRSSVFAG